MLASLISPNLSKQHLFFSPHYIFSTWFVPISLQANEMKSSLFLFEYSHSQSVFRCVLDFLFRQGPELEDIIPITLLWRHSMSGEALKIPPSSCRHLHWKMQTQSVGRHLKKKNMSYFFLQHVSAAPKLFSHMPSPLQLWSNVWAKRKILLSYLCL